MNVLFYLYGCSHCGNFLEVINRSNKNLAIQDKIIPVEILSGDPRLAFLAKYYKTDDPLQWSVPLLVIEKESPIKIFGSIVKGKNKRIIFDGAPMQHRHAEIMVENYLGGI